MKKTLEIINRLLEARLIEAYAIGDAIAALKWVEPFFTRDLDLFIIPSPALKKDRLIVLTPIYDFLGALGYKEWRGQWLMVEGVPVELIPAEGLAKEAVENAVAVEFDGVATRVIMPEYLIALFVTAGRDKDRMKVALLLEQAPVRRELLQGLLNKYQLDDRFAAFRSTGQ